MTTPSTKVPTAAEVAHRAMGDCCGNRHERFGHTASCDSMAGLVAALGEIQEAEVAGVSNIARFALEALDRALATRTGGGE